MLAILRLNFTQSAIGNFLKFVVVSIKIKRQTTKKDPHHNRASLNLLLIQQRTSGVLETKETKLKKEKRKDFPKIIDFEAGDIAGGVLDQTRQTQGTTEKEGEGGTREMSPEPCE